MEYIVEKPLSDFSFWSGAQDRAKQLTPDELDKIEDVLPELFGEKTPTETEINDLFWFDFKTVCELAGIEVDENDDVVRDNGDDDDELAANSDQFQEAVGRLAKVCGADQKIIDAVMEAAGFRR